MSKPEASVVLPSYNEASTLRNTVDVTIDSLRSFLPNSDFEVIIAEDGCTDSTPEIAFELEREYEQVHHIHSPDRLGRGRALEKAFESAQSDTLAYIDTDLATDMEHLEELVNAIRLEGYDVATGSRYFPDNEAQRPTRRKIPSKGYNFLVRVFLDSKLRDHQCGFKSLSLDAFETLKNEVEDEHWFWDTELLVRAQRHRMAVKEFPVDWKPKGDSKVNLLNDISEMGLQLGRLWWVLNVSR